MHIVGDRAQHREERQADPFDRYDFIQPQILSAKTAQPKEESDGDDGPQRSAPSHYGRL
jgi:hypothetical protein